MPILPWACAHGEAPPCQLECAETVDISPPDDSVDSNAIIIVGSGDIFSFGTGPGGFISKRIVFRPLAEGEPPDGGGPPAQITLHHNPPALVLITGSDRVIAAECYGAYACNEQGHWFELYFTPTGATALENRLLMLEQRLADLETRPKKRPRKEG